MWRDCTASDAEVQRGRRVARAAWAGPGEHGGPLLAADAGVVGRREGAVRALIALGVAALVLGADRPEMARLAAWLACGVATALLAWAVVSGGRR